MFVLGRAQPNDVQLGLPSLRLLFVRNDVNVDANSARLIDNLDWHCRGPFLVYFLVVFNFAAARSIALLARGL